MQNINGYQVSDAFVNLINDELIPPSIDRAGFWKQFTALLNHSVSACQHLNVSASQDLNVCQGKDVTLLHPRYALKAINTRWGSLYSALYHENAIPHSAGLRTGQGYNIARVSRVISYSREFLDSVFPLSEGSHKDAVSYIVYFQNLMVTLADGSTVGLKKPDQFVAKAGHREQPEAIILKNQDVHVEIRFDRCGLVGARDMANIDEIMVEAPARTVISCEADDVADKCEVMRNLRSLINGTLRVSYTKNGKLHTRRLNRNAELTARDGEAYYIEGRNPVAIQLYAGSCCPAVRDPQYKSMQSAIVDTALYSLLAQNNHTHGIALMAASPTAYQLIQSVLNLSSNGKREVQLIKGYPDSSKPSVSSTNTYTRHLPCIRIEEQELRDTATISKQNTAVLNAIQQGNLPG